MVTQELGPFDQAMSGPPTMFLVFFGVVATLVVGTFVFTAVRLFSQRRADNAAPLRSVGAMVVSGRTDDRGHLIHQGSRYKGFTRDGAVDGIR